MVGTLHLIGIYRNLWLKAADDKMLLWPDVSELEGCLSQKFCRNLCLFFFVVVVVVMMLLFPKSKVLSPPLILLLSIFYVVQYECFK